MDWLAAAAALLGGSMLVSSQRRRRLAQAGAAPGGAELDDTARQGRGRQRTPPSAAAVQVGHETQDTNVVFIGRLMAGLAVVMLGCVLGMMLLLNLFRSQLHASRPAFTAEQSTHLEPPKPELEAHPETDLHEETAAEQARLAGYAWVDAAHTRARIPIARAMQLTVGHSLDARP
jgi:hypothetical protein